MDRRRVALFFGSFNPIHIGHYEIMRHIIAHCDADEVRLIVTPKNPFGKKDLADAGERLAAARAAIAKSGLNVLVSDVEFHLPEPTYTIQTLEYLDRSEPQCEHILVIGADNLASLDKWYRYQDLIDNYGIWVYPRLGFELEALCDKYNGISKLKKIMPLVGELHNVSSTEIREGEKAGRDMSGLRM